MRGHVLKTPPPPPWAIAVSVVHYPQGKTAAPQYSTSVPWLNFLSAKMEGLACLWVPPSGVSVLQGSQENFVTHPWLVSPTTLASQGELALKLVLRATAVNVLQVLLVKIVVLS